MTVARMLRKGPWGVNLAYPVRYREESESFEPPPVEEPTVKESRSPVARRLLLWTLLFGVFVLADLALFSWLIFRSLSQREINQVVLEARSEAEELARQIAGGVEESGLDLYTAVATESDTQTYIDSVLAQREIVERVEIWDSEGRLVFRNERVEQQGDPEESESDLPLRIDRLETEMPFERVEVPVGNVGTFVIGISRAELEERLEVLRTELLRQTSVIGALTVVLFAAAYFLVWRFFLRTKRLESKAEEAARMAYVGTLAAGLAHEIRSPLNSLNLNMQLLEEEEGLGASSAASRQRLTSITRDEIGRLEHLVTDFLSYARPRRLEPEVVAAIEVLRHVSELVRTKLQARNAQLGIDDDSGGALIRADRDQLSQLLRNLIDNSLQATSGSPEIQLRARREGDRVVLSVEDNGSGMSREEQDQMFEIFFSKRKGGTGLGLAIVERIASAHDGELRVDSEPGRGTRVELLLPTVEAGRLKDHDQRGAPASASKSSGARNIAGSSSPQASHITSMTSPSLNSKT